jgi:retron-type reverse transcriptase
VRDEGKSKVELWEQVIARENLATAIKRVESNGGAPGIDGMTVKDHRPYLKEHWLEIREALEIGADKPSPVRRVEIPKPDGGMRLLGIPTVIDRHLQQAIAQVLTPIFECKFSPHSYGFRCA